MDGKPGYDLYVAATNLSKQMAEVFPTKATRPCASWTPCAPACRCRFGLKRCVDAEGHVVEQGQGDVYIDGGVLTNSFGVV